MEEEVISKQSHTMKFVWGLCVLALIGGGFLLFRNTPQAVDTVEETVGDISIEYEDGSTGVGTIVKVTIPEPALIKKSDISQSLDAFSQEQLALVIEGLNESSKDFALWNEYGAYMLVSKDYERAEEAWLYAAALRPESSLPTESLANLYGYYLKDSEKSEEYMLLAIEQEPTRIGLYARAFEIYRDVLGNEEQGIDVVKAGYEVTKDPDLKAFLVARGAL